MNEILIRKAKKGDKDAFCRLIDENVQSMYKVAAAYLKNDEDVADAIQDTILSCYENLKSLKQNCGKSRLSRYLKKLLQLFCRKVKCGKVLLPNYVTFSEKMLNQMFFH